MTIIGKLLGKICDDGEEGDVSSECIPPAVLQRRESVSESVAQIQSNAKYLGTLLCDV